jgi:hypothetical protein
MVKQEPIQLPISEKLFEELKPTWRRMAVTKLKMRVLENLRDSTHEKPGGK